jgi:hypothetical protein
VEVDRRSLAGQGPLRLQILCPDPSKLTTMISPFFFGRVGRSLSVELEREEDQRGSPSPHPTLTSLTAGMLGRATTTPLGMMMTSRTVVGGTRFHPQGTLLFPPLVCCLGRGPRWMRYSKRRLLFPRPLGRPHSLGVRRPSC